MIIFQIIFQIQKSVIPVAYTYLGLLIIPYFYNIPTKQCKITPSHYALVIMVNTALLYFFFLASSLHGITAPLSYSPLALPHHWRALNINQSLSIMEKYPNIGFMSQKKNKKTKQNNKENIQSQILIIDQHKNNFCL